MIVCSCNVLSDAQILATLATEEAARPRSPVQAYRCLGCSPQCGRCLRAVHALLANARQQVCAVGCAICPGDHHAHDHANTNVEPVAVLSAAE